MNIFIFSIYLCLKSKEILWIPDEFWVNLFKHKHFVIQLIIDFVLSNAFILSFGFVIVIVIVFVFDFVTILCLSTYSIPFHISLMSLQFLSLILCLLSFCLLCQISHVIINLLWHFNIDFIFTIKSNNLTSNWCHDDNQLTIRFLGVLSLIKYFINW